MKLHKIDGKWHCRVFLGTDASGKKIVKHFTSDTRRECEARAQAALDAFSPDTYEAGQTTVREAVSRYIERRRASLSPRTLRDYIRYQQTIFPRLMPCRIANLDDRFLQAHIDELAASVSPKTVKNQWTFLRAAIHAVDKTFEPDVELPSVKRPKFEMPDREALTTFFSYIAGKRIELPVLLACVCGLRRSEISALDIHTDVDYDRALLHVTKAVVLDEHSRWITKEPKTEAGNRLVPVPSWLLEKLRAAASDPGFKMPTPNAIEKGFCAARKNCPVGCSFHGLRHYYASVMEAAGVPELYQMERMGHSTTYMLKRYQEFLKEKEVEINDTMMSHLDALDPSRNAAK